MVLGAYPMYTSALQHLHIAHTLTRLELLQTMHGGSGHAISLGDAIACYKDKRRGMHVQPRMAT